jgi:hypothetical protein
LCGRRRERGAGEHVDVLRDPHLGVFVSAEERLSARHGRWAGRELLAVGVQARGKGVEKSVREAALVEFVAFDLFEVGRGALLVVEREELCQPTSDVADRESGALSQCRKPLGEGARRAAAVSSAEVSASSDAIVSRVALS